MSPRRAESSDFYGYKVIAPIPTKSYVMSEAELQSIVIEMAQKQGWAVKPEQNGSQNVPRRPTKLKSALGFPDLVLARDGEVLFLELKAENGKLTIEQAAWQLALPNMEVIRPSDLARGRVDELLS